MLKIRIMSYHIPGMLCKSVADPDPDPDPRRLGPDLGPDHEVSGSMLATRNCFSLMKPLIRAYRTVFNG
jgi:hypothetical protein